MNSSDFTVQSNTSLEMEKKPFEYDPEVTDFTLIVENQKLHVAKAVLIDASPVFRKMLTGEFKEKNISELELPGKKYSSFELFLRCIFPKEYYELTESHIDEILPLADEYEVKCVLQKCEHWLLTQFELKEANLKVSPHYQGVDSNVSFLMKCLYYGERYSLVEFYKKCSIKALPYRLQRYKENEHYQMLPESRKRQLVEDRLLEIERRAKKSRQSSGVSTELHECSSSLFL